MFLLKTTHKAIVFYEGIEYSGKPIGFAVSTRQ